MDSNKVAIVPLGDESREVNQILANDTARKILNLISDEPLSAMPIAYKLNLAINTAQYNLEKLEAVGLIKVIRIEKSKRGRDVKIYAPTNKIIAIIPKNVNATGIYDALRSLVPLFIVALVLSVGIDLFVYSPDNFSATQLNYAPPMPARMVENSAVAEPNDLSGSQAKSLGATYDSADSATGMDDSTGINDAEIAASAPAQAESTKEEIVGDEVTSTESNENLMDSMPEAPEPIIQEGRQEDIFDHPGIWIFIGSMGIIFFLVLEKKRKLIN